MSDTEQGAPASRTAEIAATVDRLYALYNAQDLDGLVAAMSPEVDWPDGDLRMHGRDAVRRYWAEQWTRVLTHDTPITRVEVLPGVAAIGIEQVVRDLDGAELSTARVVHVLRIEGGLATRLDIVPA